MKFNLGDYDLGYLGLGDFSLGDLGLDFNLGDFDLIPEIYFQKFWWWGGQKRISFGSLLFPSTQTVVIKSGICTIFL